MVDLAAHDLKPPTAHLAPIDTPFRHLWIGIAGEGVESLVVMVVAVEHWIVKRHRSLGTFLVIARSVPERACARARPYYTVASSAGTSSSTELWSTSSTVMSPGHRQSGESAFDEVG